MRVLALALKDLKLLFRDRMAAFFIFGFPILMGLFFGLVMGVSTSGGSGKMKIALVDQDESEISRLFVAALQRNENLALEADNYDSARESVRLGRRTGMVVISKGFGDSAGVFTETQPPIELGLDPSRSAEGAMLEGFIMQASAEIIQERFKSPAQFLPSITQRREEVRNDPNLDIASKALLGTFFDSAEKMIENASRINQNDEAESDASANPSDGGRFQFANIQKLDLQRQVEPGSVAAQVKKIRSRWDISFPQAMLWGVMGCVAGFSTSIARERTWGTMIRLEASPLHRFEILLGKALGCFIATLSVIVMMLLLGKLLGMNPASYPKLLTVAAAVGICFVGVMMTFSVLGKTEQSVAGVGWALNMVMAMFGGAMIPTMFMPNFMQSVSVISPVRWSILSIEGAIWREFSWAELLPSLGVLLLIGVTGMLIGSFILNRRRG